MVHGQCVFARGVAAVLAGVSVSEDYGAAGGRYGAMGQSDVTDKTNHQGLGQGLVGAVQHAFGRLDQLGFVAQQQNDCPPHRDETQGLEGCIQYQHGTGHGLGDGVSMTILKIALGVQAGSVMLLNTARTKVSDRTGSGSRLYQRYDTGANDDLHQKEADDCEKDCLYIFILQAAQIEIGCRKGDDGDGGVENVNESA